MADYPLPVFHFSVDWGGDKASFTEVSGLSTEAEMIEYRDGLDPSFTKINMPGLLKNNPITLKRGVFSKDNQFFEWWNTIQMNQVERRNVTISLLNENHDPVMTWKVTNAWPTKVSSPDLNSSGSDVAFESIELAHEGLTIQNS